MVVNFYDMRLSDSGRVALVKERSVVYEGRSGWTTRKRLRRWQKTS